MRKLLIGLALSVMATAAQAQVQWVFVTENSRGDKFYADLSTKRRTGNVVRMWEVTDLAKPDVIKGKASYSDRAYTQNDCAERSRQILQIALFSGKMASGDLVASENQPSDKNFVAPGTVGETILNFACK